MLAASKYVKGPKEIQLFLSQVGIVNSIEQGNKHQKSLRPGQLLVSENGALWRWDGLNIKDGSKTITYKRIISTTKLIGLEKELNDETIKINKLKKIKNLLDKKLGNIELEIKEISKKIEDSENIIMSNNNNLVEIEKELLLKSNKKETDLEEINKDKLTISNVSQQGKDIMKNILMLENIITKESREIVNIKKSISLENKKNSSLKNQFENFRIEFEINKKRIDEETIKKEKNRRRNKHNSKTNKKYSKYPINPK